jgi:hypothetical protein
MAQQFPIDAANFFTRFGDVMSEIISAETLYGTNLKKPYRELSALYWKWARDLVAGKPVSGHYIELCKLEFLVYFAICEDIIERLSRLVKHLDKPFFVDTSRYKVAMEEAKRMKTVIETRCVDETKIEECTKSMKENVDSVFKVYSDCNAERGNLVRKAFIRWSGVLAGTYSLVMLVYFQALGYMKIEPNFNLGISIPVFFGALLFGILLLWFPPYEPEDSRNV